MARKTIHWRLYFPGSRWIQQVSNRVPVHGMPHSEFQWQSDDFILGEIVFGKLHTAIEDGHQMLGFQFLRLPIRTMALQADGVGCSRAEQVIVVAAVRLVTSGATLREGWLMVIGLLRQVGNIAVAAEADIDRVCFWQARLIAGVRAVAVSAIARRSRMLYLRGFDQLGFIVVTGYAQSLGIRLRQDNFSVLRGRVANLALFVGKWRMGESCHQLGSRRLVRIVAAYAIRGFKRLVLVSLLQVRAFYVMASDTKLRHGFRKMEVELGLADLSSFMRNMTAVAAHIEGGVAAAFLGHVHPVLWQLRQRFSFSSPAVAFSNWYLLSEECGS